MTTDNHPLPGWMDRLAHDLRGPLAPLATAIHLFKSEQLPVAKNAELLALMERQVQRMGRMFDELDDSIRSGQGRLLGCRERCEAGVLLDLAFSELRNAPAIAVTASDNAAQAVVDGDMARLQQLLRTLAEYVLSQPGVDALQVGLACSQGHLRIDIALPDAGIDNPPDNDLLHRPQTGPEVAGLGLKLMLASAIAQAHSGRLWVDPPTGKQPSHQLRCELPLAD